MACIAKSIRTRRPATQQPLNRRWPVSKKASERGGLQQNNHSTADGLYRKKHPNEEAFNATTTQPQMAYIAKSIRTRRPATQHPPNRRWTVSQKASGRGGLQRNHHSTAHGLYRKKNPNQEDCNATTTQPQMAFIAKSIRTNGPATQQPLNRRWPVQKTASERGGLQRNNHSTADGLYRNNNHSTTDGLYRKKLPNEEVCNATTTQPQMACTAKKHPNEEASNATTTQPQMACIANRIRKRRPATQ